MLNRNISYHLFIDRVCIIFLSVSFFLFSLAQLPGVPEICKKSLTACPATGGLELFILGKNFLKDTKVVFQQTEGDTTVWEQSVVPDKEFLQQVSSSR